MESAYHDERTYATVTNLERKALRAALVRDENGEQDFFAFQARCIDKFACPATGIFIRQLVFWSDKGQDENGWIYKTRAELKRELGIGQRQQNKARKKLLAAGVMEEDLRTVAPRHHYRAMHYRVDLKKLKEFLDDGTEEVWYTGGSEGGEIQAQDIEDVWYTCDSEVWYTCDSDVWYTCVSDLWDTCGSDTENTQRLSSEEHVKEIPLQRPPGDKEFSLEGDLTTIDDDQPESEEKSSPGNQDTTTTAPPRPEFSETPTKAAVKWYLDYGETAADAARQFDLGNVSVKLVAEQVSYDIEGTTDNFQRYLSITDFLLAI